MQSIRPTSRSPRASSCRRTVSRNLADGVVTVVTAFLVAFLAGCNGSSAGSSSGTAPNTSGPIVTAASYVDVDGNGVDSGDVIVVTFSEPVRILSGSTFSFDLDNTLDTFGTGSSMRQSIPNSDRVEIVCGSGADFVPDVSTMDVRNGTNLSITDFTGDDAQAVTTAITIDDVTTTAPTLVSASYVDTDLDGTLNVGDTILCGFDKPVTVPPGATFAANFALPVASDTLGTTPVLTAFTSNGNNRGVLVTFDAAPTITVSGTYDNAVVTAGSASGIAMSGTPTITDSLTSGANTATASTEVDIALHTPSFFRTGAQGSLFTGNTDGSTPDVGPAGFFGAGGMCHYEGAVLGSPTVDLCFVADTENHRVLVFEGLPAGNFANANVVLGQSDFDENLANRSTSSSATAGADTLHTPVDVHFHAASNALFVSDSGNHRVLVFEDVVNTTTGALELENGDSADLVIGQTTLTSNFENQGGLPSSRSLATPAGIHIEGTQLAVADSGNHRVLIWSSIPSTNNSAASVVLGQANFTSNTIDGGLGTIDGSVLDTPNDVVIDSTVTVNSNSGAVLVADTGNNRVLVWHGTNPASGATADRVLGQAVFTTDTAGSGAAALDTPRGVEIFPTSTGFTSGDTIFVCDAGNDRVTVYDFSGSLTDGQSSASTIGGTGVPANNTLASPERVSLSIGTAAFLFVADVGNHRVMEFPVTTGTVATTATAELGQTDFTTAKPNAHTMNQPSAIAFAGGAMIVADTDNHRVLIYNTTPQSGDPTPDVVVGQTSLFDTSANQGLTAANATTLSSPTGVATDGTRLVISDTGNNRVLVFNTIPTTDGASADVVLGQTGFTGSSPNSGGITGATLDSPTGLTISGTELIVCDTDNHRVLVWSDVTTVTDGVTADVVLGQDDFSSRLPNHGDVTTAATFYSPLDVEVAGSFLWVADSNNHRVLGFPSTATSSISATRVLGQSNFSADDPGTNSSSLDTPSGVASDGNRFFISDSGASRVVVLDAFPGTVGTSFDAVLGQSGFTTGSVNRGLDNPSTVTLANPSGLYFDGRSLYVVDTGNSRIFRVR